MTTGTIAQAASTAIVKQRNQRAGLSAIAAGVTGLLYAVAFVVLQNPLLYGLCLMVGGLFTIVAIVALYERLKAIDGSLALVGLLLGVVGAFGAVVHGGYDLANAINPPPSVPDLPFAVDPRGLLTFGVAGLGLFAFAGLLRQQGTRAFSTMTYLLAALLVVIYLARLIVLNPANPILLIPVALTGFVINPIWQCWLGAMLLRRERTSVE